MREAGLEGGGEQAGPPPPPSPRTDLAVPSVEALPSPPAGPPMSIRESCSRLDRLADALLAAAAAAAALLAFAWVTNVRPLVPLPPRELPSSLSLSMPSLELALPLPKEPKAAALAASRGCSGAASTKP